MVVFCALAQMQAIQALAAKRILRQHTLDSQFHSVVRTVFHHDASFGFLQTADPAGVTAIVLLIQLLAGEYCFACVDDDDIVAAVNVGSECDLVLAAKQVGSNNSSTAQGLISCIDDVPLALKGLLLC